MAEDIAVGAGMMVLEAISALRRMLDSGEISDMAAQEEHSCQAADSVQFPVSQCEQDTLTGTAGQPAASPPLYRFSGKLVPEKKIPAVTAGGNSRGDNEEGGGAPVPMI